MPAPIMPYKGISVAIDAMVTTNPTKVPYRLYFILFTFEQLKIDNETVPLYFMGLIEEKSPIVELCSRYVRNIRFFNRNNNLNYCKELDSIPYFYYYILYSSILCE